ncbi:hypothetical protein [Microbacterium sp. YJN-G]|nr:hypothetical protein [Microbacterium sp. YJN-G]
MGKEPLVVRNIRVARTLWDETKTAADRNGETVSDVIRRALQQYVKENRL